jgi:hypothetical protein
LLRAAGNRNGDLVRWLVRECGADVHERDHRGWTAFSLAVYKGNIEVAEFLLRECGADLHARTTHGLTALLVAVSNFHTETVQFLLQCGADVTDADNGGLGLWSTLKRGLLAMNTKQLCNEPAALADLYSVLRCYSSPADPIAYIGGLQCQVNAHATDGDDDDGYDLGLLGFVETVAGALPDRHRELLLRTERAHVIVQPYRAQRLALLHEGSDFARIVIPDLQTIVADYAQQSTADEQSCAAVIAEAAVAEKHAREHGVE